MMKTAVRYLTVALLLTGVSIAFLFRSQLERQIVDADRNLATLNLARATQQYDAIASSLTPISRLPWLLRDTRNTIAARQAAVRYWRGDYRCSFCHRSI